MASSANTRQVWNKLSLLIFILLLLALALRLFRLEAREVWHDEAFAVPRAEKGLESIFHGTITPIEGAPAVHPLLFCFFLRHWMSLGQGPFIVGFPSMVFSLLSIGLCGQRFPRWRVE